MGLLPFLVMVVVGGAAAMAGYLLLLGMFVAIFNMIFRGFGD